MSGQLSSFYPALTFSSQHSRFTLHYPRSLADVGSFHRAMTDAETTQYLKGPFAPRSDMTFEDALRVSKDEAANKNRVVLDVHQQIRGEDDAYNYEWLGFVALLRMEGEEFFEAAQVEKDGTENCERVGEIGVILDHKNQRNGVLSEVIVSIYDLAFRSPSGSSQPISDPTEISKNGFNLAKVYTVTNFQNLPMKAFMENTLGLKALDLDNDRKKLSQFMQQHVEEELKKKEDERITVYCLDRQDWFGGKRENLINKVERKYLSKAKSNE